MGFRPAHIAGHINCPVGTLGLGRIAAARLPVGLLLHRRPSSHEATAAASDHAKLGAEVRTPARKTADLAGGSFEEPAVSASTGRREEAVDPEPRATVSQLNHASVCSRVRGSGPRSPTSVRCSEGESYRIPRFAD